MEQPFITIVIIIIALLMAYVIRSYFIFVTTVTSISMLPLLDPGDKVLTRRIYNFSDIRRGDILVFYSAELDKTLIKRVLGLPGDFIEIKSDGSVFINSELLEEPYLAYRAGKGGLFRVPRGQYFLAGDNRPKSSDSRNWEKAYVPEKHILGKALFSLKPFKALHQNIRRT